MAHFALIGRRLVHSYSKRYFDNKFCAEGLPHTYDLLELATIDELGYVIEDHQLSGFNVTIPYKQQIMPLLSGLDAEAKAIGAVNVVKVHGKQLIGYNTDAPAFRDTLMPHLKPYHTNALVLGTGGAAKALGHVLNQLGIQHTFVSRTPDSRSIDYREASSRLASTPILINATPVGTYPNVYDMPELELKGLSTKHLVYDLIYNPSPSRLLNEASKYGADTENGLGMLYRQAELSFMIWANIKE
ncbi:MAG: shikimate dehydrogenase [Bacteroidales bacterium]|nr:shikimate dehydrogenase [Bacteroidales bacterium]